MVEDVIELSTEEICGINDNFRKGLKDQSYDRSLCRLTATRAFAEYERRFEVLKFFAELPDSYFDEDVDPYGERNCAIVEFDGHKFMFRISYYDGDLKCFGYDWFVMTVMFSNEY